MNTSPSVGTAKPATHDSVVVFPDPDGPSRVRNSPACAVRVTPSTARVAPKVLTSPSRRTSAPFDGPLAFIHEHGIAGLKRPLTRPSSPSGARGSLAPLLRTWRRARLTPAPSARERAGVRVALIS